MKTLRLFTLAVMAVCTLAACNNDGKNKDGNPMAAESPSGDPAVKTETGSESCGDTCHNSCAELSEAALTGSWEQPVPGMDGRQGIKLDSGGTASSINMATLVIDKWSLSGDSLTLSGKSIGNGRTIDFKEAYTIEKCCPDSLILSQNGAVVFRYARAE